jgi:hypothetical protein
VEDNPPENQLPDGSSGPNAGQGAVGRAALRNVSGDRRRQMVLQRTNQSRQRLKLMAIGLALLVIAGILTAGFVIAFVLPPRQALVKVNDITYSRGDLVDALRAQQAQSRLFDLEFQASQEIFSALQLFVEDEILSQVAAKYGISVEDEEIDRLIESDLLATDLRLDPETLRVNFEELYGQRLNELQVSKTDHRMLTGRSILRAKFREFVGEQVPRIAEQVHYHRIVMTVGTEVDIMLVKLKDGLAEATTPEERQVVWRNVTREFSLDEPEVVRLGGDIGWLPLGSSDVYAETILSLEIGKVSAPITDIESPKVVLFFMVSEVDAARELAEADLEDMKSRALQDWINIERDNHIIDATFDSVIYTWMLEQLSQSAIATPTVPANPFANTGGGF